MPVAAGWKSTEQDPRTTVQLLASKAPAPELAKLTVSPSIGAPLAASVTVAVQVVSCEVVMAAGLQLSAVWLEESTPVLSCWLVVPVEPAKVASPL